MIMLAFILMVMALSGCTAEASEGTENYSVPNAVYQVQYYDRYIYNDTKLMAKKYEGYENITAMIVPHHTTASTMIASAFMTADTDYDTVIIIAPNHKAVGGKIVYSQCGWQTEFGTVENCDEFKQMIADDKVLQAVLSNEFVNADHSATTIIPYVADWVPDAKVATLLLSGNITEEMASRIADIIKAYGQHHKVLVIGSVDFSHYQLPKQAAKNTDTVKMLVESKNLGALLKLDGQFLDCPQALAVIMKYAEKIEQKLSLADESNSYTQMKIPQQSVTVEEGTTTYLVYLLS